MTDRQNIWYMMFLRLISLLEPFRAELIKPAIIFITHDKFTGKVTEIEELQSGKGNVTAGKVNVKNDLRQKLEKLIFYIASSLHSFAITNSLTELKAISDVHVSDLSKVRDSALYDKANEVNDLAAANLTGLDDYDITQADLDDLKTTAEDYKAALGSSTGSRTLSAEETEKLEALYKEALRILEEEQDMHMQTLKMKRPDIAAVYFDARKLVITGVRHENNIEETTVDTTTPAE